MFPGSEGLADNPDRQGLVTFDEAGIYPLRLPHHLNIVEPLEDFFPDNLQLQFRQPDPDATMNTEAERDVGARPGAVDNEVVGAVDHVLVAVARDVPHHHLVALLDLAAAELEIRKRGA